MLCHVIPMRSGRTACVFFALSLLHVLAIGGAQHGGQTTAEVLAKLGIAEFESKLENMGVHTVTDLRDKLGVSEMRTLGIKIG